MKKRTFEEIFLKEGTMYIGDAIPTPKYRRPVPPPPPRITKETLITILDMDYESPIKVCQDEMKTKIDNDIFEVVQSCGISVDKDELTKALKYDRQQYVKGFRDGVRKFAEMLKRIEGLEENELFHNVVDDIVEELGGECIG